MRNLCKKPKCLNWSLCRRDYCRIHNKEMEEKAEEYYKELSWREIVENETNK